MTCGSAAVENPTQHPLRQPQQSKGGPHPLSSDTAGCHLAYVGQSTKDHIRTFSFMLLHQSRSQFLSKVHNTEHLMELVLCITEDCSRRGLSFLLLLGECVPVYSPLPPYLPLRWKDVARLSLSLCGWGWPWSPDLAISSSTEYWAYRWAPHPAQSVFLGSSGSSRDGSENRVQHIAGLHLFLKGWSILLAMLGKVSTSVRQIGEPHMTQAFLRFVFLCWKRPMALWSVSNCLFKCWVSEKKCSLGLIEWRS